MAEPSGHSNAKAQHTQQVPEGARTSCYSHRNAVYAAGLLFVDCYRPVKRCRPREAQHAGRGYAADTAHCSWSIHTEPLQGTYSGTSLQTSLALTWYSDAEVDRSVSCCVHYMLTMYSAGATHSTVPQCNSGRSMTSRLQTYKSTVESTTPSRRSCPA